MSIEVTPDEVLAWSDVDSTLAEYTEAEQDLLQLVVDVATTIAVEYGKPLDEDDPDPNQEAVMRLAIIMQAVRLWKRRTTPEGITSVFDGVAAMRVSGYDPDIARLIQTYRSWGVA